LDTDKEFLRAIDERIRQRSEELESLLNEKEMLESKVSEAQQWLERAKALREAEAMKMVGVKSIQATVAKSHRFFGMLPREACHVVLRERKRMSKAELAEELEKGGYQFGKSSPLRVVHFALARDPDVKMDVYGNVEWMGKVN